PDRIEGIDIAVKMLEIGREKIAKKRLDSLIRLQPGDAEQIPFPDHSFDAVTVAFGVRNFTDLVKGLSEMKRVLRPGGHMLILEFSHPGSFPMKHLYAFYSRFVIPVVGKRVSGSNTAYTYLPETVAAFPSGQAFLDIMNELDLKALSQYRLSAGIASIYVAEK
ncbi:MAG TPA: ubiquinone/menaquinone biosynthesis methyltransferase, partial [Bacteroidales bacterium]|nr:ubiquinone/menaquinone biosynthesis methyltransferase [Bacteroidales bacterium]